jgi:hypothetical protein
MKKLDSYNIDEFNDAHGISVAELAELCSIDRDVKYYPHSIYSGMRNGWRAEDLGDEVVFVSTKVSFKKKHLEALKASKC